MLNSHIIPPKHLCFHAASFHKAAKTLAASFRPEDEPLAEAAASPVVFMYQHALELYLKSIVVGNAGKFLATKPDPISVGKTHSLSWLAQFVCQIVTRLDWEAAFRCEGVDSFADFKAIIEDINSADPGAYVVRSPVDATEKGIREFARKMDAVLDLLDATAGALAAEWDLRADAMEMDTEDGGSEFKQTIQ